MTVDFSPLGLFLRADPIVKGVIILLALASLVSWSIIFSKLIAFLRLASEAARFERQAREGTTAQGGPLSRAIDAAGLRASSDLDESERRAERRERIVRAMRSVAASAFKAREAGLPFLATIGSSGPFIGLFGTVWGIMNAFMSIGATHETSLDVVAPGIAEALFATAIGLVAAIPAVIGYNALLSILRRAAGRFDAGILLIGERLAVRNALTQRKAS